MTEQEFDHIDYRLALLQLPKDIRWLVCELDDQASDFPDYENVTLTKMLCGALDCYFQVYRIPKDLATQPVGNLFGGVTVYQTRSADNVEEILNELVRTLDEKEKVTDSDLKGSLQNAEEQMGKVPYWQLEHLLLSHAVQWMFENYEIGRRVPKVKQDD